MRANRINLFILSGAILLLFSCKKQTEEFQSEPLSDYLPLVAGKYITYRTDSTVFTNFGRDTEIHSYQEKDIVDAQVPDALGRPSYRVFRYIRDTAGTGSWKPAGSFFITPLQNTIEVIENNLRVVKLILPVKEENTWKGNRFLPDDPYSSLYTFNFDIDVPSWDYTYTALGNSLTLNGQTVNNVLRVDGIDQSFNVQVTDPSIIAYDYYLEDNYAKGIGLVSQQQIMWEYQPNTSGQGGGFKTGFGVKRSMIDHN